MRPTIRIKHHSRDGGLEQVTVISSEDLAVALRCYRPEQEEAWQFRNNVQAEQLVIDELGESDITERVYFCSTPDQFMATTRSEYDYELLLSVINRMATEVTA